KVTRLSLSRKTTCGQGRLVANAMTRVARISSMTAYATAPAKRPVSCWAQWGWSAAARVGTSPARWAATLAAVAAVVSLPALNASLCGEFRVTALARTTPTAVQMTTHGGGSSATATRIAAEVEEKALIWARTRTSAASPFATAISPVRATGNSGD